MTRPDARTRPAALSATPGGRVPAGVLGKRALIFQRFFIVLEILMAFHRNADVGFEYLWNNETCLEPL
ncbi:MAG: hypothetical protein NXH82_09385 [Rhodobacteraceae bacterium]|nr:hypothetical protein [Paracoccaceae bacterium]